MFSTVLHVGGTSRRNGVANLHAPQKGIPKGLRPFGGVQRQRLWQVQGRALVVRSAKRPPRGKFETVGFNSDFRVV